MFDGNHRTQLPTHTVKTIGVATFVPITAGAARVVHHLAGVPFEADDLCDSALFQSVLAIVWGVLALVLMAPS